MKNTKVIFGTLVGAMAGIALVALGEYLIGKMFHLPEGTNMDDKKAMAAAIASMPATAFILLLVNYGIASAIAGAVGTLVSGKTSKLPALIAGGILTAAGLMNILSIPQPIWFDVINLAEYIPCAYAGYLVLRRKEVVTGS